jgi:hypothetical protein
VRNHARSVLACDFFVTVTATFRVFYIFVVLAVGTRRILHWNLTEHRRRIGRRNSSGWWCRAILHRFVLHDHDSIYSEGVDRTVAAMGLTVLKTPCGRRKRTRSASD